MDVLANDLFGDTYAGLRRITSVSYGSEGGRVDIAADGRSVRYTPPADFAGKEKFTYFVNRDGQVTPLDALHTINAINRTGMGPLKGDSAQRQIRFSRELLLDVTGDGSLTPLDALRVINRLNQQAEAEAEWANWGEAAVAPPLDGAISTLRPATAASDRTIPLSQAVPPLGPAVSAGSASVPSVPRSMPSGEHNEADIDATSLEIDQYFSAWTLP